MSFTKKLAAALLSAVMLISALTVTAGAAELFSGASVLRPMQTVSETAPKKNSKYYYKIVLKEPGKIQFNYFATTTDTLAMYDSKGNTVISEDTFRNVSYINGDNKNEKPRSYHLKKGVYYLKLTIKEKGKFYNDFHYSFEPDKKPDMLLKVTLKKGDTLALGAVKENYSGSVKWQSTDTSVVTVSGGNVKAKKAGSAYIKLICGSEYIKLKVIVK